MQTIRPGSAAEWESVRELFRKYWGSFGFSACFQNLEREVAGLPKGGLNLRGLVPGNVRISAKSAPPLLGPGRFLCHESAAAGPAHRACFFGDGLPPGA